MLLVGFLVRKYCVASREYRSVFHTGGVPVFYYDLYLLDFTGKQKWSADLLLSCVSGHHFSYITQVMAVLLQHCVGSPWKLKSLRANLQPHKP